jgi:hypothetical protein
MPRRASWPLSLEPGWFGRSLQRRIGADAARAPSVSGCAETGSDCRFSGPATLLTRPHLPAAPCPGGLQCVPPCAKTRVRHRQQTVKASERCPWKEWIADANSWRASLKDEAPSVAGLDPRWHMEKTRAGEPFVPQFDFFEGGRPFCSAVLTFSKRRGHACLRGEFVRQLNLSLAPSGSGEAPLGKRRIL